MIINKPAGSITIFRSTRRGLSEHTAPYDAVVTIPTAVRGLGRGRTHQMREGDTIIFPANVPHALSAITRFKMSLTMIRE